jgi:hypothetical protein
MYDDFRRSGRHKIGDAYSDAMPGPEEIALSNSLQALVRQAAADRAFTRDKILGEMGYKTITGPDGKPVLAKLTDEERKALMSPTEQNRSKASQIYAERAKKAMEGTTELPPFLQKEFDAQKAAEDEVRTQLLGEHAGSAAAQQAMEQLKKREKNVRFNLQEQDKLDAFAKSKGLGDLNREASAKRVAGYNNLVNYSAPVIGSSASLLNYLQGKRTGKLNDDLTNLSLNNQQAYNFLNAGGTGLGLLTLASLNRPNTTTPITGGGTTGMNYGAGGFA